MELWGPDGLELKKDEEGNEAVFSTRELVSEVLGEQNSKWESIISQEHSETIGRIGL